MTRARQRRTQICRGFGEIAEVDVDREVALARPVEDVHDLVVLEGLWKHPEETHQRRYRRYFWRSADKGSGGKGHAKGRRWTAGMVTLTKRDRPRTRKEFP